MTVTNSFKCFIKHFQDLPERNFQRLKAKEQAIHKIEVESPEYFISLPHIIKTSFTRCSIFGDLNYARFHRELGGVRRYFIYAVPNLFVSAVASLIAIPALVLKTTISALLILKNMWNKSFVDATDPFLNNASDLMDALLMAVSGVALGIAKLALSIFRDPYQIYLERRELRNNPEGNIALIGVDPQKTFVKGGNLAVPDGELIADTAREMMNAAAVTEILTILTQDWHDGDHISYAANAGLPVFTTVEARGLKDQVLWPAHAMQNTAEAGFLDELPMDKVKYVVRKGYGLDDSYSGFFDNGKVHATVLHELLQSRNVKKLILFGLATDFCVNFTAQDAKELGYDVVIVEDASKGTSSATTQQAKIMLQEKGIRFVNTKDVIHDGKLLFP